MLLIQLDNLEIDLLQRVKKIYFLKCDNDPRHHDSALMTNDHAARRNHGKAWTVPVFHFFHGATSEFNSRQRRVTKAGEGQSGSIDDWNLLQLFPLGECATLVTAQPAQLLPEPIKKGLGTAPTAGFERMPWH